MPNNENYIAQITLPNNITYQLKDAFAREQIAAITGTVSGVMKWVGTTTTALTDGATTNPITVNGSNYTAIAGDVVAYGDLEFAWSALGHWCEFGSTGSLKALAFADTATGSITPSGTVSQPIFTGTQATVSVSGTATGSVAVEVTPAGTVSQPTFTGTQNQPISVTGKAKGNVTISTGNGTVNYTPGGTVSQPTFTGEEEDVEVQGSGTISVTITKENSGSTNYTPKGDVTPSITLNTTTVNSITDAGTLPQLTTSVVGEVLTIGFSAGSLPTIGDNQTVATSIKSQTASFTGEAVRLTGSFSGNQLTSTGKFTPSGTVTQPVFNGDGVELKGAFSGTNATFSGTFTPEGTVSQPTFTGTATEYTSDSASLTVAASGTFTPDGEVSQPTFSGTQAIITVTPDPVS